MKKLFLILAIALTVLTVGNAQRTSDDIAIENERCITLRFKVSIISLPAVLNTPNTNGTVTLDIYANGFWQYTFPYSPQGTYDVSICVPNPPSDIYVNAKLDLNTNYCNGGACPIIWWSGKAVASQEFNFYQRVYNLNIYETNFYELIKHGGISSDDNHLIDK